MEFFTSPELWVAFATLLALEIVLGIDNVVFISILSNRLPAHQQARARTIGISLALITRLLLLASLSWVIGLTAPLFTTLGQEISGRDLILILGGLFLLGKATYEIHEHLEGAEHAQSRKTVSFAAVIAQILILDVVFSLDSVITAVGMVEQLYIMVAAVVIAMVIMLVSAGAVSRFVAAHPTVKMLALAFLILIGGSLVAEGFDQHIAKGYVYGPIAFSIFVEFLNLRLRARQQRRRATKPSPEGAPAGAAPPEGAPAELAPAETAPAETAPAEGAPAEGAPPAPAQAAQSAQPVRLHPTYVKPAAGETSVNPPRG